MALRNGIKAAQILQQKSHVVPGKIKVTEHFFKVPLDHSKPTGESIRIFARSAERVKKPAVPEENPNDKLPWFLYFQGGPGFGCPPVGAGGWQEFVMDKGYKVLMLDTRGNGLSNTIDTEQLLKRDGPEEQAKYLKHFITDSIVKDAEAIRMALTEDYPENKKKWSVLGQSFGGFCAVSYLSQYPHALREVFTTGGLPPLIKQPDALYAKLVQRARNASNKYYENFPDDIGRMHRIVDHVTNNATRTLTGGLLLPERLQNLGVGLGFTGFAETLHNLILRMDNDLEMFGEFSRPTLSSVDQQSPFNDQILYALIHEPIYMYGSASNWSAERVIKETYGFNALEAKKDEPIMFTVEMITHNIFASHSSLAPLLPAAEILARDTDWPEAYNEAQLAQNEVPTYAAIYFDDLYVDFDYQQETAAKIKGCKVFITNTMDHNGIRASPGKVMEELWTLRDDERL